MAQTTRVFRSLTIYLLFCLFVAQLVSRNTTNIGKNRNLHTLMVSRDCNQAKIDTSNSNGVKRYIKIAPTQLQHSRPLQSPRLLNITLAANLIVLSHDVSLSLGSATTLPVETIGLRISHLNIHSLRYKLNELRLFRDQHKPHILAVNETWLDESFTDEELFPQGYNVMRTDRNRDGGKGAVYVT